MTKVDKCFVRRETLGEDGNSTLLYCCKKSNKMNVGLGIHGEEALSEKSRNEKVRPVKVRLRV